MALVFDIGCNCGNWTEANIKQNDMFVVVDALPSAIKTVTEKFKDKWNVKIVHALISDFDDVTQSFYVSGASSGEVSTASMRWKNTSRHRESGYYIDSIEVKSKTIDSLITQFGKPSVIKIDIEGYELEALRGLSDKVDCLMFEYAEEFKDDLLLSIERCKAIGFTDFHIQFADQYDFRPSNKDFINYHQMYGHIVKNFMPKRKELWGMIHCK